MAQNKKILTKFRWNGKEITADLQKHIDIQVGRAANYLKADIQKSMKRGGGGSVSRRRTGKVRRSRPGDVPFVQTGRGRQSIFAERESPGVWKVGTALHYMVYHELGINYTNAGFQQRPFIMPSVNRNKQLLAAIIFNPFR